MTGTEAFLQIVRLRMPLGFVDYLANIKMVFYEIINKVKEKRLNNSTAFIQN